MATMPVDGYKFVHSAIKKVSEVEKGYTYFAENDILLAKIMPCFENGKCGIAVNLKNGIGFGSTEFIVLRPKADILPEYLYIFIANSNFIENGRSVMSGTVGQQRLQIDFVKNFKIPVVNIEKQREIINEINDIYSLITSNKKIASKHNKIRCKDSFNRFGNKTKKRKRKLNSLTHLIYFLKRQCTLSIKEVKMWVVDLLWLYLKTNSFT